MADLENKRKFLVGAAHADLQQRLVALIQTHVINAMVFRADDGLNLLQKIENDTPHVVFVEVDIPKKNGIEVVENILRKEKQLPAIVILNEIPDTEHFVDEVAVGRVQFLNRGADDVHFHQVIVRSLNWIGKGAGLEFSLRYLAAGDVLIRKGDKADFVYILKSGNMEALAHEGGLEIVLGKIGPQEFVGEMAYITGESRSADVVARTDCELIEIPVGHLDRLLFQKPAWAKALMKTLTRRVQLSNNMKLGD